MTWHDQARERVIKLQNDLGARGNTAAGDLKRFGSAADVCLDVNDIDHMKHSAMAVQPAACVPGMANIRSMHGDLDLNDPQWGMTAAVRQKAAENSTRARSHLRKVDDPPPLDVGRALAPLAGMVRSSAERMNSLALSLLWLA